MLKAAVCASLQLGKAGAVTKASAGPSCSSTKETSPPRSARYLPGGAGAALELVGTPTLPDTLRSVRVHGVVCFTGMLSNQWTVRDFYPLDYLPTGVRLTAYKGDAADLPPRALQDSSTPSPLARPPSRSAACTGSTSRGGAHRHGAEPGQRQARRHDLRWLPTGGRNELKSRFSRPGHVGSTIRKTLARRRPRRHVHGAARHPAAGAGGGTRGSRARRSRR